MLYIWAGNERQAAIYARLHRVPKWKAVTQLKDVLGMNNAEIVRTGTWYHGAEFNEINEYILSHPTIKLC